MNLYTNHTQVGAIIIRIALTNNAHLYHLHLIAEAVGLLSRVQQVIHSNVVTPRSINVVFKRLGFAQLVAA